MGSIARSPATGVAGVVRQEVNTWRAAGCSRTSAMATVSSKALAVCQAGVAKTKIKCALSDSHFSEVSE